MLKNLNLPIGLHKFGKNSRLELLMLLILLSKVTTNFANSFLIKL